MNYRKLEGLESEDKWGNKTKIIDVDSDVIVIATYRNHCHDTCITRQIWREDYYPEPILLGGYERMKEELLNCGFDLDKIKQNVDLSYEKVDRNQEKFKKELFSVKGTPPTFA